jgi:aminoglycoside 6'-N-acetyltransferase I
MLIGWSGAMRAYSQEWELHPLVVDPQHQNRGVGSALLAPLETRAIRDGAITLHLGSDEDCDGTNLLGR